MTEIVSSFTQFGWAVALLALVLVGVGTALGLFFNAYLKRQDREFEATQQERREYKKSSDAQQELIRVLAHQATEGQIKTANAMKEASKVQIQATQAMSEMIQALGILNENYRVHREKDMDSLMALRSEHQEILNKVEVQQ